MGTTTASRSETTTAQKVMGAWAIERFGDPRRERSLLSLEKLPVPKVEARDVLIRMYGAEVGDWDALVASGEWSVERSFPIVLGLAGAGSVVAVGKDVVGLEKGDAVYTYSHPLSHRGCRSRHHNGAWAEYMLVPFRRVALAPMSLDLTHAGAAPIVGLTAHETIVDILKVERHDVVLITAAAGGVGHLAVQIAARRGARVIAIARRQNHEFLRALGAEFLIDYTRQDFVETIRANFPAGVDKALNGVEGATANKVIQAVRPRGHVVDLTGSATASLPDCRVDIDYVVRPDRVRLATLAHMFDRGELKLEIAHPVPFARARDGLAEVLTKQVRGVLVLKIP
ncbi:MAG TPA: NADP-dependent oxidoreductase [Labilithrix sp.]|nr:NADP-dependent oxidoreductase [Labilithrix sp.]